MTDWLPISNVFPSFSQITSRNLLDPMADIIDFAFTPFIDLYKSLHNLTLLQTAVETINLRQYVPVIFANVLGAWRALDPRIHLEEWGGVDNIGRLVLLVSEIGIGLMIIRDIMAYYSTPADYATPVNHSTPATPVSKEDATSDPLLSSSQAETSSEFKSASTSRTNTISTTTTNTANSNRDGNEHHRTISPYQTPTQAYTPPDRVLQRFICPKFSSTWPPYYLQAFQKAQESMRKEDNIHVDAPPSSGTRGNKDGCVGKIVLDKRIVKKDLKNGVVGYREGITGTGNWEGIKWK